MDSIISVIQNSKVIREWLNGGLLPLNMCLVIVIGLYLYDTRHEHGRGWTRVPGVKTACVLWWIFLADGIRAGTAWLLLRVEIGSRPVFDIHGYLDTEGINFLFTVAGIIGVCASLQCIWLFTPRAWGHWCWISSALVTVAWLAFTHQ